MREKKYKLTWDEYFKMLYKKAKLYDLEHPPIDEAQEQARLEAEEQQREKDEDERLQNLIKYRR